MDSDWRFGPEVIAEARELGIGDRVAVHWCEAECQDQEGVVVGVKIERFGKITYAVHIDGDQSPTDEFTIDRSGVDCGSIRMLESVSARALVAAKREGMEKAAEIVERESAMAHNGSVHPTGKAHAAAIRQAAKEMEQ